MQQREVQNLARIVAGVLQRREGRIAVAALVLVGLVVWFVAGCPGVRRSHPEAHSDPAVIDEEPYAEEKEVPPPGPGRFLFCFWNVENLFDDKDDRRTGTADAQYDSWFARDEAARAQKLSNLCDVLLGMNDGKGPDLLALAELESRRAADLLRQALNQRLKKPELRYPYLANEPGSGGRHISTALISRIPVNDTRTQSLDKKLRVLETRVTVADQELVLIPSHWSSRISDKDGATRGRYGDLIYKRFAALYGRNPKVDLLVCGDFNDNPDDPSVVKHLWAIGNGALVSKGGDDPYLFNPFAKLYADGQASLYYNAKPFLFDQICVSPGLLDAEGWTAEVKTARVVPEMATRQGRPNRFGGEKDRRPLELRGASDHFPVTVWLSVRGG